MLHILLLPSGLSEACWHAGLGPGQTQLHHRHSGSSLQCSAEAGPSWPYLRASWEAPEVRGDTRLLVAPPSLDQDSTQKSGL